MSDKPLPGSTEYFDLTYPALSAFEQAVLQICSVIYDGTDISTLLSCLYESELPTGLDPKEYPRKIGPCLEKLVNLDLLTSTRQCHPLYVEMCSRQAVNEGHMQQIATTVRTKIPESAASLIPSSHDRSPSLRELRIDLYCGDIDGYQRRLVDLLGHPGSQHGMRHPMVHICNTPFDGQWFSTLPLHVQLFALHEIIKHAFVTLEPLDNLAAYLQMPQPHSPYQLILEHPSFLYLLLFIYLVQGRFQAADELLEQHSEKLQGLGIRGGLPFLHGNNSEALTAFRQDLAILRSADDQGNAFFTGIEGVLFCLALLKSNTKEALREVQTITQTIKESGGGELFGPAYELLGQLALIKNDPCTLDPLFIDNQHLETNPLCLLIAALSSYWSKGRINRMIREKVEEKAHKSFANGYRWLAMEYASLLIRLSGSSRQWSRYSEAMRHSGPLAPLVDSMTHEEPWRLALQDLKEIAQPQVEIRPPHRLVWYIRSGPLETDIKIIPKEQRLRESGSWSRGRRISCKKLFMQEDVECMTEQDRSISAFIRRKKSGGSGITYAFDIEEALYAMAGHPHVYLADAPHIHMEIIRSEPELRVRQIDDAIKLDFFPPVGEEKFVLVRETFSSLKVYLISESHRRIAEIIGDHGLLIPTQAKKQILQVVRQVAGHLNVFSEIGGSSASHEKIEADSRLIIQILPAGTGFRLSMFVRPFGNRGPYLKPGAGASTIFSEISGHLLQSDRDLLQEEEHSRLVEERCPVLTLHESGDFEWLLPEPAECLQFLMDVRSVPNVTIEWPKGERLKIKMKAGAEHCQVKIRRQGNWFAIDGTLPVDEERILTMKDLLEKSAAENSRFIPLGDGEFLALTDELHNYLELLNATARTEEEILVHPLSAPALESFTSLGENLQASDDWYELLNRVRQAETLHLEVPSTLETELRDYQLRGYQWMNRLAHWGAGACLADDMGLGKTIQTLAVILSQASHGPCLVIAPTSVCFNWLSEIHRFAPTLNAALLSGSDRKKQVEELGPFDLLISSYGLLQQEPEILTNKEWQIIALDEGQAIKNMNTKRSAAAMRLQGRFRIITTGTPIENNLGELWNLFRFLNPGLLGTLKQFNRRFAIPIEKEKRRDAKARLKTVISPFIMRRLKSQVLDELPPRTEINLFVTLNEEESAFYEALRRQALKNIDKVADRENRGAGQMTILAEIMKLRRACCNPRLAVPDSRLASSKMALFEETIDELQANNHKVLVFSQFVDHLAIIRNFLEKKKISYQYLDGSTPAQQRKNRVDAFQAGEGDVFLISLRAGGLGLNLTAANYVIHMDPWWNPAVEDQASDRAHRIGQRRPVTIYKLITRNTIEEKIIRLHREKKDLADSLLAGTDISDRISAEDLLALLRQEL